MNCVSQREANSKASCTTSAVPGSIWIPDFSISPAVFFFAQASRLVWASEFFTFSTEASKCFRMASRKGDVGWMSLQIRRRDAKLMIGFSGGLFASMLSGREA